MPMVLQSTRIGNLLSRASFNVSRFMSEAGFQDPPVASLFTASPAPGVQLMARRLQCLRGYYAHLDADLLGL